MRCLDSIIDSMDVNFSKLWETVKDRAPDMLQAMELKNVRYDLAIE